MPGLLRPVSPAPTALLIYLRQPAALLYWKKLPQTAANPAAIGQLLRTAPREQWVRLSQTDWADEMGLEDGGQGEVGVLDKSIHKGIAWTGARRDVVM